MLRYRWLSPALLIVLAGMLYVCWRNSDAPSPRLPVSPSPRLLDAGKTAGREDRETGLRRDEAAASAQAGGRGEKTSRWQRWGGALNSASIGGAGFFDRRLAREFTAEAALNLKKYVIDLNARALLPLSGGEALAFLKTTSTPAASHASLYMQFYEHPTEAQRAKLAGTGVQLIAYVSAYAWSARGKPGAFLNAAELDFVRGFAAIDPRDKLHPEVYLGTTPFYALAHDGRARFSVLALPETAEQDFSRQLSGIPPLERGTGSNIAASGTLAAPSALGPRFEVLAAAEQAERIAALDAVAYVEYIAPPAASRDATTDAESNIGDVRDQPPNLDGAGITVAVREVGKPIIHIDYASRTQLIDSDGQSDSDNVSHATAVLGQVGSNGAVQPAARGVAPAVSMLVYALSSTPFDPQDVVNAASNGARISNHSYGPINLASFGEYRTDSANWDAALRANNLLGVFAGNEGSGGHFKHIDYFVGAKNTLCVSATNSSASAGNDNPPTPPSDGIASFSEFGPMNDGRVKPDLVAYGDHVVLDFGTNDTRTGSGTSFATPVAAGAAALVFEEYKAVVGNEPSAALAKAILCNSATDLGNKGPDAQYGFGILNVKEAVRTVNLRTSPVKTPFLEGILSNGSRQTFLVNISASANVSSSANVSGSATVPQLKATLCWLDVPGNPAAARALVNDLDLQLIGPDMKVYFPYSLDPDNPASSASNLGPNLVDPIEQTVVDAPQSGTWTISVAGSSIPQGTQTFGLCLNVQGIKSTAAFISASPVKGPAPLAVSFSGNFSSGTIQQYAWDFGDGLTDTGVNVQHVYAQAGTYTATLTVTDDKGVTDAATLEIIVLKSALPVFPLQAKASLNFIQTSASSLQLKVVVPPLVMSRQQARQAVKDGIWNKTNFRVRAGKQGSEPVQLHNFMLDSRASDIRSLEKFKLDLVHGIIMVSFKDSPEHPLTGPKSIFEQLGISASTMGPLQVPMHVEFESDDALHAALYTADFQLKYTSRKNGGTAVKAPGQ